METSWNCDQRLLCREQKHLCRSSEILHTERIWIGIPFSQERRSGPAGRADFDPRARRKIRYDPNGVLLGSVVLVQPVNEEAETASELLTLELIDKSFQLTQAASPLEAMLLRK